jgi:putative membrane protein
MTNTVTSSSVSSARIKRLNTIAWIITIVIWLLVGVMRRYKFDVNYDLGFLAGINALCNTGVSIALLIALYFIRRKRIEQHRRSIYVAMVLSACFLLSYVTYHFTTPEVPFCKEGLMRIVYYIVLFSHIVIAGLSLPFILLTFIRGYVRDDVRHKRMARWVYPFWLYVALTGPLVYLLLLPCR